MSEIFTVVPRETVPHVGESRRPMNAVTRAVIETAETGAAVRIDLNGRKWGNVYHSAALTVKRRGLQLRMRRDGAVLYLWCEQKKETA